MRNHLFCGAFGVALTLFVGTAAANAQIMPPPGVDDPVIAQRPYVGARVVTQRTVTTPVETVETVRTTRSVRPRYGRHVVRHRTAARVVTARTIVRKRAVPVRAAIAATRPALAAATIAPAVPAVAPPVYIERPGFYNDRPGFYDDHLGFYDDQFGYDRPGYDETVPVGPAYNAALPATAPVVGPLVGEPVLGPPVVGPAVAVATPMPAYRYVYEPDRILVIDNNTGIAVQAIPR